MWLRDHTEMYNIFFEVYNSNFIFTFIFRRYKSDTNEDRTNYIIELLTYLLHGAESFFRS